jgi:hypothetical protein
MQAMVHFTSQHATPSELVFGRDAVLNASFKADWQYIKARKQTFIKQNNKRENATPLPQTYNVGDKIVVEQDPNRKHSENRYKGPYEITHVFDNGTVRFTQDTPNGGVISQTWNIRELVPYKA